jgi:hypothetical protein
MRKDPRGSFFFCCAPDSVRTLATSCVQKTGNLAGANLPAGVCCLDAVAKAGNPDAHRALERGLDFPRQWRSHGHQLLGGHGRRRAAVQRVLGAERRHDHDTSAFRGNILAGGAAGSITLPGGTLAGRALANVAVTMTGAGVIGFCCARRARSHVCRRTDCVPANIIAGNVRQRTVPAERKEDNCYPTDGLQALGPG